MAPLRKREGQEQCMPCDSARPSMSAVARSLMAGVIGAISVCRAASPFFRRASSTLSLQPWTRASAMTSSGG